MPKLESCASVFADVPDEEFQRPGLRALLSRSPSPSAGHGDLNSPLSPSGETAEINEGRIRIEDAKERERRTEGGRNDTGEKDVSWRGGTAKALERHCPYADADPDDSHLRCACVHDIEKPRPSSGSQVPLTRVHTSDQSHGEMSSQGTHARPDDKHTTPSPKLQEMNARASKTGGYEQGHQCKSGCQRSVEEEEGGEEEEDNEDERNVQTDDSFLSVLPKDGGASLRWPLAVLRYTHTKPSLPYSCNPRHTHRLTHTHLLRATPDARTHRGTPAASEDVIPYLHATQDAPSACCAMASASKETSSPRNVPASPTHSHSSTPDTGEAAQVSPNKHTQRKQRPGSQRTDSTVTHALTRVVEASHTNTHALVAHRLSTLSTHMHAKHRSTAEEQEMAAGCRETPESEPVDVVVKPKRASQLTRVKRRKHRRKTATNMKQTENREDGLHVASDQRDTENSPAPCFAADQGQGRKKHARRKRAAEESVSSPVAVVTPERSLKSVVVKSFSSPPSKRRRKRRVERKLVEAFHLERWTPFSPEPSTARCAAVAVDDYSSWSHDFDIYKQDDGYEGIPGGRHSFESRSFRLSDEDEETEMRLGNWDEPSPPHVLFRPSWSRESSQPPSYICLPS